MRRPQRRLCVPFALVLRPPRTADFRPASLQFSSTRASQSRSLPRSETHRCFRPMAKRPGHHDGAAARTYAEMCPMLNEAPGRPFNLFRRGFLWARISPHPLTPQLSTGPLAARAGKYGVCTHTGRFPHALRRWGACFCFKGLLQLTSANEYYVCYEWCGRKFGYWMVRVRGWVVGGGPPGVKADRVRVYVLAGVPD